MLQLAELDIFVPLSQSTWFDLQEERAFRKTCWVCYSTVRSASMPKIISYTPPWLSRPSPGSQAFTNPLNRGSSPSKRSSYLGSPNREIAQQSYYGPHRLLARRGTEIFVVVGSEIRWLDLHMVKNDWEEQTSHAANRRDLPEPQDESQVSPYRV